MSNNTKLSNTKKFTEVDTYIELLIQKHGVPKDSLRPINDEAMTIRTADKQRLLVSFKNFNGYYTLKGSIECRVCRVRITDKVAHKLEEKHLNLLAQKIQDKHCIRKLDRAYHHCILCNEVIVSVEVHLQISDEHKWHLEAALLSVKYDLTSEPSNKGFSYCQISNVNVTASNIKSNKQELHQSFKKNNCNIDMNTCLNKIRKRLLCQVCKIWAPSTVQYIAEHMTSRQHLKTYLSILKFNKISKGGNRFTCGVCDQYLCNGKEIDHALSNNHKKNLLKTLVKRSSANGDSKNSKYLYHITVIGDNKHRCTVCSVPVKNGNIKKHLNKCYHRINYYTLLFSNTIGKKLNGTYFCQTCNVYLMPNNEIKHIETENHKYATRKKYRSQNNRKISTRVTENNNNDLDTCDLNATVLGMNKFILLGEDKYFCEICHEMVKEDNLTEHVNGKTHIVNHKSYINKSTTDGDACEEDVYYYCVVCRIYMFDIPSCIKNHIAGKIHIKTLRTIMEAIHTEDNRESGTFNSTEPFIANKDNGSNADNVDEKLTKNEKRSQAVEPDIFISGAIDAERNEYIFRRNRNPHSKSNINQPVRGNEMGPEMHSWTDNNSPTRPPSAFPWPQVPSANVVPTIMPTFFPMPQLPFINQPRPIGPTYFCGPTCPPIPFTLVRPELSYTSPFSTPTNFNNIAASSTNHFKSDESNISTESAILNKNEMTPPTPIVDIIEIINKVIICKICEITIPSAYYIYIHINDPTHHQAWKLKVERNKIIQINGSYYACNFCYVNIETTILSHITSDTHKNNVHLSELNQQSSIKDLNESNPSVPSILSSLEAVKNAATANKAASTNLSSPEGLKKAANANKAASTNLSCPESVKNAANANKAASINFSSSEAMKNAANTNKAASTYLSSPEAVKNVANANKAASTNLSSPEAAINAANANKAASTNFSSPEAAINAANVNKAASTNFISPESVKNAANANKAVSTNLSSPEAVKNAANANKAASTNLSSFEVAINAANANKAASTNLSSPEAAINAANVNKAASTNFISPESVKNAANANKAVSTNLSSPEAVKNAANANKADSTNLSIPEAAINAANANKAASTNLSSFEVAINAANANKAASTNLSSPEAEKNAANANKAASANFISPESVKNAANANKAASTNLSTPEAAKNAANANKAASTSLLSPEAVKNKANANEAALLTLEHYNNMMLTTEQLNEVTCRICKKNVPKKNFVEHVASEAHNMMYDGVLNYNCITKVNEIFYCRKCKEYVTWKGLLDHIEVTHQIIDGVKNYQITVVGSKVMCKVCKVEIPNAIEKVKEHIKETSHITNHDKILQTNRLALEGENVLCGLCDFRFKAANQLLHIENSFHKMQISKLKDK